MAEKKYLDKDGITKLKELIDADYLAKNQGAENAGKVLGIGNDGNVTPVTGSSGGGTAAETSYDNTSSGLTADNVQDAIDELANSSGGGTAADTSYDNSDSGLIADNVQDAIDELNDKIPISLSELSSDATHRIVTDTEKATWNAKSDFSGSYSDLTNKPTSLPNPHSLTFGSKSYDGSSAVTLATSDLFDSTTTKYETDFTGSATIVHNLAQDYVIAQFFDADGKKVNLEWTCLTENSIRVTAPNADLYHAIILAQGTPETASDIPLAPIAGMNADNVQDGIEELKENIDEAKSQLSESIAEISVMSGYRDKISFTGGKIYDLMKEFHTGDVVYLSYDSVENAQTGVVTNAMFYYITKDGNFVVIKPNNNQIFTVGRIATDVVPSGEFKGIRFITSNDLGTGAIKHFTVGVNGELVKMIQDAEDDAEEKVSALRNDFESDFVRKDGTDMVTALNSEFIKKSVQYLDTNKAFNKKFWSSGGATNRTMNTTSDATYWAYEPIELDSGDYWLFLPYGKTGHAIYETFASFVQPSNGNPQQLKDFIVENILYGKKIRLTEQSTLFLTVAYIEGTSTFDLTEYAFCNSDERPLEYQVGIYGRFFIPNLKLSQEQASASNVIHVSKDGNGDYTDIQSAIDHANDSATNHVIIYIGAGEYDKFSMINSGNKLRYIDLIGESELTTVVKSDTGNYSTPAGGIRTNGIVKNLHFIQKATSESYISGGIYNYSYAVHDDFGACNVVYENCIFESNAGPAVGLGMDQDKNMVFRHCIFVGTADGTFGSKDLGAFFAHTYNTSSVVVTEQNLTIDSCLFENKNGTRSALFSQMTTSVGSTNNLLIMNSGFNAMNSSHGVAFQGGKWLDERSFNNNYTEL